MFKKIDKYLLENHPVVWNTKFVGMTLILLLFNVVFFVMGYLSFGSAVELQEYNVFNRYFSSVYVWFGILAALLILFLWLNQYFKHNAFKSHYPKSNSSLYKEFLIVFMIIFMLSGTYFSFTKGLEVRIAGLKTESQLEKDIDLVNKVGPFTLQELRYQDGRSYSHAGRCVDVPQFDSLVSKDDVLKLYVQNKFDSWELNSDDTVNYQKFADSLKHKLYKYHEFESVLIKHFPNRKDWKSPQDFKTQEEYSSINYTEPYYETETVYVEDAVDYAASEVVRATETISFNLNSIYNACGIVIYPNDSTKNNVYYAQKLKSLLDNQEKDSIETMLNQYLKLADELQVGYRFQDKNWIDYVYNPPYYFVDYELSNASRYSEKHLKTFKKDYVAESALSTSLQNIEKAHYGIIKLNEIISWLYFSMAFTLLIFTFRTTSLRTWIIALVGSIVVFFILLCAFFVLSRIFYDAYDILVGILFLSAVILFWILSISPINGNSWKLISGVNLNWKIWTFGAIIPVVVGLYSTYLSRKYPYAYNQEQYQHPHEIWINQNFDIIFLANFGLILLYILLILPLLKKWQAMADE